MEDLLNYLIKSIVDVEYEIEKQEYEGGVNFIIKLPKEVMGMVIGKEGKTINAIRTLLKVRATLEKVRANVELQEKLA